LTGEKNPVRAVAGHDSGGRGLPRAGREGESVGWKLLAHREDQHVELYDLKNDLSEQRDLAKDQPAKAAELREKLHAGRTSVGAQMPTVNPDFKPGKDKGKGK
jgi:hypothetical protein